MNPVPVGIRISAVLAPVLLLLYGVLRLIDGLDGEHGPGLAWNLGHALFFAGFVALGVLVVGFRGLVSGDSAGRARIVANAAMAVGLYGVGCFLWVILGDLFGNVDDAAPLPDALRMSGPLAFQLGWLTLSVMLVITRPRRLPVWSPVSLLAGFVLFAADLDLLPIGALFLLAGLGPLARTADTGLKGSDGSPTSTES